jgi:SagB-type dehydrogenase family enzyme
MPVAQAIRQRRSRRQYADDSVTLQELSFLLWATQGVQKHLKSGFGLRTVPAAGARHPFETYLSVHRVEGLDSGAYRYVADEHRLLCLFVDPDMANRMSQCRGGARLLKSCAVYFIWTAVPYRKEWLHGYEGDVAVALEVGHVCQNLYLASEAIGCGTCATGLGQPDGSRYDELLGVDGQGEFSVYAAAVGKLRSRRDVEWSGLIESVEARGDSTLLWVKSLSWWEGDVFVAHFDPTTVTGYASGDYVAIGGQVVDVCSEHDGWPLVKGNSIERRKDPSAASDD